MLRLRCLLKWNRDKNHGDHVNHHSKSCFDRNWTNHLTRNISVSLFSQASGIRFHEALFQLTIAIVYLRAVPLLKNDIKLLDVENCFNWPIYVRCRRIISSFQILAFSDLKLKKCQSINHLIDFAFFFYMKIISKLVVLIGR